MNDSICIKNIFVGGSTELTDERKGIYSVIHRINDENVLMRYSEEMLPYLLYNSCETIGESQVDYDSFINDSADFNIFIINETLGDLSKKELKIAVTKHMTSSGIARLVVCVSEKCKKSVKDEIRQILNDRVYPVNYDTLDKLQNKLEQKLRAYTRKLKSEAYSNNISSKSRSDDSIINFLSSMSSIN